MKKYAKQPSVRTRCINTSNRQNTQFKDNRYLNSLIQNVGNNRQPIQRVITRSMAEIIRTTIFYDQEDVNKFTNYYGKLYCADAITTMITEIGQRQESAQQNGRPIFYNSRDYLAEKDQLDLEELNEDSANKMDHGDLDEYDDPNMIDCYVYELLQRGIIQCARKAHTVSGPKTYETSTLGKFTNVAYMTDSKGSINFSSPYEKSKLDRKNPVLPDSTVNIPNSIDKSNRAHHFAFADKAYANKCRQQASYITEFRKGKYTWHHLSTPRQMILVDMIVHRKHGHNGGVYLW